MEKILASHSNEIRHLVASGWKIFMIISGGVSDKATADIHWLPVMSARSGFVGNYSQHASCMGESHNHQLTASIF